MKPLWQDIRYGARSLFKNPEFTSVAVLSLALGIGVNTVIFSIVDGALLKRLPYRDPDRLVSLVDQARGISSSKIGLTQAELFRIREQGQTLSEVAGYYGAFYVNYGSFRDAENPRRFLWAAVTPNLFSLLGYQPILGRGFLERNAPQPGQAPTAPSEVIFSYNMWQGQFGGDPKVLNTTVTISGVPMVVVGVMPREFHLPADLINDENFEVYYPVYLNPARLDWSYHGLTAVGALKPGKQLSELQADLEVVFSRLRQERPDAYPAGMKSALIAMSLREDLVGNVRLTLLLLMGAVALVLLIACMNVANLLLARATGRHKEMALRATLGASRGRLVRQLFTEALLLAVVACVAGLLLAHWCLRLMLTLTPVGALPRADEVVLDGRVLAFSVVVSVAASLLFGLAPAFETSRFDMNRALREEGRSATGGASRQRIRRALVVSEVALAFVLVIGAGLLLRSFGKLLQVDLGFNPHKVITARVSLPVSSYRHTAEVMAFFNSFRQRMQDTPGVSAAAAVSAIPLSGRSGGDTLFDIEGRPTAQAGSGGAGSSFPHVDLNVIVPGYFETMEMRLIRGRLLAESDREDQPLAAVINETLVRRFFPGDDPLGKRVCLYLGVDKRTPWIEIVGVVADNKMTALDEQPKQQMFLPEGQVERLTGYPATSMSLLVKANAGLLPAQFRSVVRAVDPLLAVFDVEPVDKYVARVLARPRFILILLAAFAAIAFLLAVIGIYGLVSYSVTQRTREIGIRMALGAQRRNILKLIVGQGSVVAVIGVVIGLAVSFALTRVIRSLLYGVSATDPVTFVSVTAVLIVVAALASYLPARRAARVDPTVALRTE